MGNPANPHHKTAVTRLRAGERPAAIAKSLGIHPQTVYTWRHQERVAKRAVVVSLVEIADHMSAWIGDPKEVSVLLLRRNRLRAGLAELKGNRV